jgi:AraC family transcriptional regulator
MSTITAEIVTRGAFRVAGMRYEGKNEHGEIPQMWEEFLPRSSEITVNLDPGAFLGIARSMPGVPESEGFEYLAGVQVSATAELPNGMVAWEVPTLTYAVLPAKDVAGIGPVSNDFYQKWLPQSTEWKMGAGLMIEYYPPSYAQDMIIFLNFPIQKK